MRLLWLLFLVPVIGFSGTVLTETIMVNPYSLPGDSERTQLSLPGIRLHEANDWAGSTDKLVSEAANLAVSVNYLKYFSSSIAYKGRYFTPALRTKNGEDKLPAPLGAFAEWAETTFNQSVTLYKEDGWFALKLDGGLGYNDLGDHSFTDIYRSVHDALKDPDESDQFGTRLDDHFISSTYSGSLVIPLGSRINLIGSYQVMNSKFFREDAQEATLIYNFGEAWALSAKYSFVKQRHSEYLSLRNNRSQYIVGLRLFKFWTPSVMHVTPYIKEDTFGQWYFSPLSLTYPF